MSDNQKKALCSLRISRANPHIIRANPHYHTNMQLLIYIKNPSIDIYSIPGFFLL